MLIYDASTVFHLILYFLFTECYADEQLIKSIESYREKWHDEIKAYTEVKESISHLQTDVSVMKKVLDEFEKGELQLTNFYV